MIHITWVSDDVRGRRHSYDTDKVHEALAEATSRWFNGSEPQKHSEKNIVFCIVVERDDHQLEPQEIADKIRQISQTEQYRVHRDIHD